MGGFGGTGQLSNSLRLLGLAAACLALTNCANGNIFSRVDPTSIAIATTADAEHAKASLRFKIDYRQNPPPEGNGARGCITS